MPQRALADGGAVHAEAAGDGAEGGLVEADFLRGRDLAQARVHARRHVTDGVLDGSPLAHACMKA